MHWNIQWITWCPVGVHQVSSHRLKEVLSIFVLHETSAKPFEELRSVATTTASVSRRSCRRRKDAWWPSWYMVPVAGSSRSSALNQRCSSTRQTSCRSTTRWSVRTTSITTVRGPSAWKPRLTLMQLTGLVTAFHQLLIKWTNETEILIEHFWIFFFTYSPTFRQFYQNQVKYIHILLYINSVRCDLWWFPGKQEGIWRPMCLKDIAYGNRLTTRLIRGECGPIWSWSSWSIYLTWIYWCVL